jgi:hypothetical protein
LKIFQFVKSYCANIILTVNYVVMTLQLGCVSVVVTAVAVMLASCGRVNFDELADAPSTISPRAMDGGPQDYRGLIMADLPIGYWRLNDNSDVAVDETGRYPGAYSATCAHGAQGVLRNDPNTAVSMTGSCRIDVSTSLSFIGNAPYSIEAFVRPTQSLRTGHIFARQTRDATRPINGYSLVLNEGSQIYQERTGNNHVATSVVAIPLNEYSHVVGVYDGAAMLIYIDGLLRVSTPTTDPMRDFNARVLIGCSIPDQWCFYGDIDEVAVYDRALLDVTIAAHFAAR